MIDGWLVLDALRNGKIVRMFDNYGNSRIFKMEIYDEDKDNLELVERCGKDWITAVIDFNVLLDADCMVTEDYDLTFEEAIRAMLDGKIVASEHLPNRIFKFDKKFMWASRHDVNPSWSNSATCSTIEQEGMWRVIE